ncbi:hypothetical protein J6590_042963 [Homalodisca vitripennis]|nr:hypothetical protein J6590_042963 [Homalodisca vitripennis]
MSTLRAKSGFQNEFYWSWSEFSISMIVDDWNSLGEQKLRGVRVAIVSLCDFSEMQDLNCVDTRFLNVNSSSPSSVMYAHSRQQTVSRPVNKVGLCKTVCDNVRVCCTLVRTKAEFILFHNKFTNDGLPLTK